jgi:NAD(P)-dependent dehydrogenase (short-subunit alcohol dehydrogenase family)
MTADMDRTVPSLSIPGEFRNRVAVVTGGTNGLGRHLAQTLVGIGARVFFCGRQDDLGRELTEQWGERAHFVHCDLADADATRAFIETAGQHCGGIDYLVNNAAIDPVASLELSTIEHFDRTIAINLRSYFVTVQTALPFLKKAGGKAVVNLGTTNWMLGEANHTMYAAAKSGILGLSRSMAREFGHCGIRVNMVSPGWIMTERQLREKVTEKAKQKLLEDTSVGILLDEQHVTPAILFLLSAASGGISGQNLVVDGGKYFQ